MKDQVQVPFDTRGDTTEKERNNAPKNLSRPHISESLKAPRSNGAWLRRRCNCGNWSCNSPATGDPPGYYWEYFDIDGRKIDAEAEGLPFDGDRDGSGSQGWRVGASEDQIDRMFRAWVASNPRDTWW